MRRLLLIILAGSLAFAGCKSKEDKAREDLIKQIREDVNKGSSGDDDNSSSSYSGNKEISIRAPYGWTKSETTYAGYKAIVLKSKQEDDYDDFMENVNVVSESCGSMSLDKYMDISINQMDGQLTGFDKGKEDDEHFNGLDFKTMEFTHVYNGTPIEAKVYVTISGGKAYVITCSAAENKYRKFEDQFETAVHSFELK